MRTLICFPIGDNPGLRAEAGQLALGLAASDSEVLAFGALGAWRHPLRMARVTALDFTLPGNERKLTQAIQDAEPRLIHAFGIDAAHLVLPLTLLVGAGGVVTLGHEDPARLNPNHLRTASAVFVPCEIMREQVTRRLPALSVVTSGHLLAPPPAVLASQLRFLADELGLLDGAPMVLLADALRGGDPTAAALIDALPFIVKRAPGAQVLIAGDGPLLQDLEARALEMNTQLGYRAVLLPGQRDDVPLLLALATVAVGSGRFAAEALGAGTALIAAGLAGMLGAVSPDVLEEAQATCWGRHGNLEPVTARGLAADIVGLLDYPQYRRQFAEDGQAWMLARADREQRARQITTYYSHTAPTGTIGRTPQRVTAVLPTDLREALFTLPALAGLHAKFPLAKLTLVTDERHRDLLQALGLAERVLTRPLHPLDWWTFTRALCKPRADVCLSFTQDVPAAVMAACSLAPHRLGFAEGAGSICYSDHLHARSVFSPERAGMLVQALGVTAGAPPPPPELPAAARAAADSLLLGIGVMGIEQLVLVCPQADPAREWPREHWLTLLGRLAEDGDLYVAVMGAADWELPEGIMSLALPDDDVTLAALLARASLVIAPDAAPLHLADLLAIPTIGLYDRTTPCFANPRAQSLTAPAGTDLSGITPDEVAEAVARWRSSGN